MFMAASAGLRDHVYSKAGQNRVVVEKPFGKDFDSSKELSRSLAQRWDEEEVIVLLILYVRFIESITILAKKWSKIFLWYFQLLISRSRFDLQMSFLEQYGIDTTSTMSKSHSRRK